MPPSPCRRLGVLARPLPTRSAQPAPLPRPAATARVSIRRRCFLVALTRKPPLQDVLLSLLRRGRRPAPPPGSTPAPVYAAIWLPLRPPWPALARLGPALRPMPGSVPWCRRLAAATAAPTTPPAPSAAPPPSPPLAPLPSQLAPGLAPLPRRGLMANAATRLGSLRELGPAYGRLAYAPA